MVNHSVVLEQNIRLHRTEAYYYVSTHPENFNIFEQRRLRTEIRRLAKKMAPRAKVLDLASGTGNVAEAFRHTGVSVIACDLSAEMLRENRAEHRVLCDITRLPFRDGSFSGVTAYSVFHHLPDPAGTVKEATRVSGPNSVLYFDHDRFLPSTRRTLGHYPFTLTDLLGWVLWLSIRPRRLKRLAEYLFRGGRREHIRVSGQVDQAESHDRVKTPELVSILEEHGFRVRLAAHGGGSYLEAIRTADFRGER